MPNDTSLKNTSKGSYFHLYNKGIESRVIFSDKEDHTVFVGFINEYLDLPKGKEDSKKTFTVKGRTYKGVPHQPKNYYGKIELISYSLMPDHFHLLLNEIVPGSRERLMRSLLTRYSMYFNKKYKRTGSLFQGPYKFVEIVENSQLLLISKYLASGESHKDKTAWVKSSAMLALFEKTKKEFDGVKTYADFVAKYKTSQKEQDQLERILFERPASQAQIQESEPKLEGRDLKLERIEKEEKETDDVEENIFQGVPELIVGCLVFMLLFAIGLRNIKAANKVEVKPAPVVSGVSTQSDLETKEVKDQVVALKKTVIISTDGGTVNIRRAPNSKSEKIGSAEIGDSYEYVSLNEGWYQVKLGHGVTGFIAAEFAVEGGSQ